MSYLDYIKKSKAILSDDLHELFVSSKIDDAGEQIPQILGKYGMVVVTDVLTSEECDFYTSQIVQTVTKLSDGVDHTDLSTWKDNRLMPQVSPGVFNCGIGNTRAVWSVRLNPKVKQVYAQAYGTDDLISSVEMINVKPPIEPFHDPTKNDWAHTDNHKLFDRCVQGQVVLSDTTAGPLCSPKSHLVCAALVGFRRKHNINSDPVARAEAKRMVESVGGKFQVPVIAPKGSVIIWLSSMLHSAKLMDRPAESETFDDWKGWKRVVYLACSIIVWLSSMLYFAKLIIRSAETETCDGWKCVIYFTCNVIIWFLVLIYFDKLMDQSVKSKTFDGWRCVVYLAYRPRSDVDDKHLAQLKLAYEKNMTTRHTGDLFDTKDISNYPDHTKYSAKIHDIYQSVIMNGVFPIEELKQELTPDVMTVLGMH